MRDSSHNRGEMQKHSAVKENSVAKREIYKLKSPPRFLSYRSEFFND